MDNIAFLEKKRFLVIPLIVAVVAILGIWFLYRSEFNGDYSQSSGDWGDFGSYFGGVASPIIAVFSLLAVLVTIHLQAQILRKQMDDFKQLHQLQSDTLEQAQEQIKLQKSAIEETKLQAEQNISMHIEQLNSEAMSRQQENCLSSIDALIQQQVAFYDVKVETFNMEVKLYEMEVLDSSSKGALAQGVQFKIAKAQKELLDFRVEHCALLQSFHLLSVEVLSPKFQSHKELESFFVKEVREIMAEIETKA